MEYWDIYDMYRKKKGYYVEKDALLKSGEYHLVVHVCVFNKNNEMLIQKRKKTKANWPGMWDFSSGGAAIAGENTNMAAERELKEELAINVSLSNVRPIVTVHFDDGFDDYYAIEVDEKISNQIAFMREEIEEIKWASYDEIVDMIDGGEFGVKKSFVGLIFDMRKQRGTRL